MDGLIVRGAKMLATHGPTADELLVYPLPGIREGEERYVLAFGIPTATPRVFASFAASRSTTATQSQWDHPLGARFEEPDAVCVFDDVLIPWDRVFLYGDVKMGNALFAQASIRNHTGHQTAIRGLAKCQLMTGIAIALTRAVKSDVLPARAGAARRTAWAICSSSRPRSCWRSTRPSRPAAARSAPPMRRCRRCATTCRRCYERMVQVTQVLSCRRPADQSDGSRPSLRDRARYRSATIRAPASMPTSASSSPSWPGTLPARNSASACCNTSATTPVTRCGSGPPIISTMMSRRCSHRCSGRCADRSWAGTARRRVDYPNLRAPDNAPSAAFATCLSCSPVPDPTPIPPMTWPSTMIGSPPGRLMRLP